MPWHFIIQGILNEDSVLSPPAIWLFTLPVTEQHRVLTGVGIEAVVAGEMIRLSSPTKWSAENINEDWQQRIDYHH